MHSRCSLAEKIQRFLPSLASLARAYGCGWHSSHKQAQVNKGHGDPNLALVVDGYDDHELVETETRKDWGANQSLMKVSVHLLLWVGQGFNDRECWILLPICQLICYLRLLKGTHWRVEIPRLSHGLRKWCCQPSEPLEQLCHCTVDKNPCWGSPSLYPMADFHNIPLLLDYGIRMYWNSQAKASTTIQRETMKERALWQGVDKGTNDVEVHSWK